MLPLFLFVTAFVPMLLEARRSRANEQIVRARGAREPENDVYRAMQVLYPACFAAMVLEAWWRGSGLTPVVSAGAGVFFAAKALKYWAIAALGERWTFRVLVVPGAPLVASGPYRYLNHPNYVAVVGELLGMALMAQAPITGPLAIVVFGALIYARIQVEERALARHRSTDQPSPPVRASEGSGSGAL